ncbi:DNA repair protein RecN [bacterium]|nr:DNA repair protein RecN [bacterium]
MLNYLRVKNFLLIKDIELNFSAGLNVFTGETGVGKTVLVNAMKLLSGNLKIKKELLQKENIDIQAVFDIENNEERKEILSKFGFETDELFLRVSSGASGRFKFYVNDIMVKKETYIEIASGILDIHSQHANQSLLDPKNQIKLYDHFIGLDDGLVSYKKEYNDYIKLRSQLDHIVLEKESIQKEYDFIKYQYDEIKKVNPQPGEDEELRKKLTLAKDFYKIEENVSSSINILYDSDNAIITQLKELLNRIETLSEVDPSFKPFADDIRSFEEGSFDLIRSLEKLNRDDISDLDIDNIQNRLSDIEKLFKYGATLDEILKYKEELKEKFSLFDLSQLEIKELKEALVLKRKKVVELALKLRIHRQKNSKKFEEHVERELSKIAMDGVKFEINIKKYDKNEDRYLSSHGIDDIEFVIDTTNRGLFPLNMIASGGELSRIMLVLKELFSNNDTVETLVFDEIDAGIGGETAVFVGEKIRNISKIKQVISITHLHQITKFADKHFKVEKYDEDGTIYSKIASLNKKERIKEIARMLGGDKISPKTIKLAEEIVNSDNNS